MTLPNTSNLLSECFQSANSSRAQDPCPSPEEISRCASGELDLATSRRIIEHCARCPDCAADWRAASSLFDQYIDLSLAESDIEDPEENVVTLFSKKSPFNEEDESKAPFLVPFSRSQLSDSDKNYTSLGLAPKDKDRRAVSNQPRRSLRWMALAAGFAAIFVGGTHLLGEDESFSERLDQPSALRSHDPQVDLAQYQWSSGRFIWPQTHANEVACKVVLLDGKLENFASLPVKTPGTAVVPQDLSSRLSRESSFYWQVRCEPSSVGPTLHPLVHQIKNPNL